MLPYSNWPTTRNPLVGPVEFLSRLSDAAITDATGVGLRGSQDHDDPSRLSSRPRPGCRRRAGAAAVTCAGALAALGDLGRLVHVVVGLEMNARRGFDSSVD